MDGTKAEVTSEVIKNYSTAAAAVLVPLVIWLGSSLVSVALEERETELKKLELAIDILRESPIEDQPATGIRGWAADQINLTGDARTEAIGNKISIAYSDDVYPNTTEHYLYEASLLVDDVVTCENYQELMAKAAIIERTEEPKSSLSTKEKWLIILSSGCYIDKIQREPTKEQQAAELIRQGFKLTKILDQ